MSDRIPPLSDETASRAVDSQEETQVEIAIPAIGSDQGLILNIPISSTKISILRQNSDKNHCRFRINHSQLEKNHDSQDIHDLSP